MSNGYIYCVSTPANNDRCKVGETLKGIEDRLRGLNTTSVSENFKLDYYIIVNPKKRFNIEKSIHNDIINAGYSRFTGKEFFKCNPNDIKHIFEKYGNIYTSINEHKNVEDLNENKKIDESNENIITLSNIRQCDKCKKIFNKKSSYDCHISRKHSCIKNENSNKCMNCNKIYSTRYNLKVHNNSCKINQNLVNNDNIKEDIILKYKKLYKCEKCNKIFNRKSTYDTHMMRKNPCKIDININNTCSICNKSFTQKYNLNKHAITCKKNIIIDNSIDKLMNILSEQQKKIDKLIEINQSLSNLLLNK